MLNLQRKNLISCKCTLGVFATTGQPQNKSRHQMEKPRRGHRVEAWTWQDTSVVIYELPLVS